MAVKTHSIRDPRIFVLAMADSFIKLNPMTLARNPVIFVTKVGAAISTVLLIADYGNDFGFQFQVTLWLWLIVLSANFAEAMAEGWTG